MVALRRLQLIASHLLSPTSAASSSDEEAAARLQELLSIRANLDATIEDLALAGRAAPQPPQQPQQPTPPPEFELRPLEPEDFHGLAQLNSYVFGKPSPERVVSWLSAIPPESWDSLCAFTARGIDGREQQLACSFWCRHFTMEANGRALALAGIAGVGTHPDHRRQGLLRTIMTQQFQVMRARGQTCAALWASQAAIYQRYGFGEVTSNRAYEIDTVDVAFADGDGGSAVVNQAQLSDPATVETIRQLYAAFISTRCGYLQREVEEGWHPTWGKCTSIPLCF